eukprot:5914887-Amphidinium_carterae.1
MRGRTCPRSVCQDVLLRDRVPSRKAHLSEPHISDRVVAMYAGAMGTAEDMGPMSVQHVRTAAAGLCDIFAREICREQQGSEAHAYAQAEDLCGHEVFCWGSIPRKRELMLKAPCSLLGPKALRMGGLMVRVGL